MITLKKQEIDLSYVWEGPLFPKKSVIVSFNDISRHWALDVWDHRYSLCTSISTKEAGRILTSCKLIGLDGKIHKPRHRNKTLLDKALKLLGEPI